jgi:hypothetical protein
MLNYFKAFFIFLVWACIALTSHYFLTVQNFNEVSGKTVYKQRPLYAIINSKKDTIFKYNQPFKVIKNSSKILNLNDFKWLLDSLSLYLKNHYDKKLIITGIAYFNEKDSTTTNKIGLLRAKNIASYFKNKQINSYQINTQSKLDSNLYSHQINLSGINLEVTNISSKTLDSLEKKIINKRIYVNFKNNKLISNNDLKNYLYLLKQYIEVHPQKNIYITGHTDNDGYYQKNLIIGLKRANLIKDYFCQNGIENTKIRTSSKGESEPIANRYTLEGKAKNRRIEIKIN